MIKPTFSDKLAEKNLLGLPFSWGPDGKLEFGPGITEEQRKEIEAIAAAHDWALSQAKDKAIMEAKANAAFSIAALFDKSPFSLELVFAELNALAEAIALVDKVEHTPQDTARLAQLKSLWGQVQVIRQEENAATRAIEEAKSEGEIP
jgi:hypothetical protein